MNSSCKSITNGSFSDVTRRGTRSASTVFEARRELLAVHAAPEAACTASEAARLAEALEQESVPREVTSMCQPTQSIMTCEDRGRTDVTSARNVVARCVSSGPGPAEHPLSRRTTLDTMTLSRLSRCIGSQTQVEIRSTRHAVEHQRSENIIWVVHGSLGLM